MINVPSMPDHEHMVLFEACLVRTCTPTAAFKEYYTLMHMRRLLNQANADAAVAHDQLAQSLENLKIEICANQSICLHDLEITDTTRGIIQCRVCGATIGDLE